MTYSTIRVKSTVIFDLIGVNALKSFLPGSLLNVAEKGQAQENKNKLSAELLFTKPSTHIHPDSHTHICTPGKHAYYPCTLRMAWIFVTCHGDTHQRKEWAGFMQNNSS